MKYNPKDFEKTLADHVTLSGATKVVDPFTYYHASPSGKFVTSSSGIHVGTLKAAQEALNARIGIKADGTDWDGTTVYGQTKIAGEMRLKWMDPKGYNMTGYNAKPPVEDYYPTNPKADKPTYGDGSRIAMSSRPRFFRVQIVGPMKNRRQSPVADLFANSKRRSKVVGYYYRNIAEDEGSISAVVPDATWLKFL